MNDNNFADQFVYLALYDESGSYINALMLSPVEAERIDALKAKGYETVSHSAYQRFVTKQLTQPVQRKHDGCAVCGRTSAETALYHSPFRNQGDYLCWTCYHKQAIELGEVGFGNGTVGKNAGWAYRYTFAKAIESALYEIELQQSMDMGISVDAPIGGSYMATAIVRNHQLYVRMADLSDLEDMGHDDRIKYIDSIVKQLTFELLQSKEIKSP